MRLKTNSLAVVGLYLLLAGLITPGCAIPFSPFASKTPELTEDIPQYGLRVRPASGEPVERLIPLQPGTTVQMALEEAGLDRSSEVLEITLVRPPNPQVPKLHKMNVKWDAAQRHVTIDTDYALFPGDLLEVQGSRTSIAENALQRVLGPLDMMSR